MRCQETVVPKWALKANESPTLICFDELNRASLAVRNATLQILLEREIGVDFKFNKDVYIVGLGNLGEEDGTDVEEFDSALNNRAIHVKHNITIPEWINDFANGRVHPLIISHVKNKPEEFYKMVDNSPAFATPRSWTHLSDFIVKHCGIESDATTVKNTVQNVASFYVGPSATSFLRYLDTIQIVNINDVLNNFSKVKSVIESMNRDIRSELLSNLKELDINEFTEKQYKNVVKFLKIVSEDECVSYMLHVLDETTSLVKTSNAWKLLHTEFEEYRLKINELNSI